MIVWGSCSSLVHSRPPTACPVRLPLPLSLSLSLSLSLFHTQPSHTTLSHTTLSHTTLSETTLLNTTLSLHIFHTQLFHLQLLHIHIFHTPAFLYHCHTCFVLIGRRGYPVLQFMVPPRGQTPAGRDDWPNPNSSSARRHMLVPWV